MIGVIIQARMGSQRLPGKILKKIGNKNLLEHILFRLSFLNHPVKIVIATSNSAKDDIVEEFCKTNSIECFRGSEDNVLERYYFCAKKYSFEQIVRLTGDNPFLDIEELDNLIDLQLKTCSEYSKSFESLPIGIGAEIFSFSALEKSYFNGQELHHKEHVNEYILENSHLFKISNLKIRAEKNINTIRLTVDTEDDLKKACFIIENAGNEFIITEDAIKLCMQYA